MFLCSASRLSAALAAFSTSVSSGDREFELCRERGEAGHEAGARFRRAPPDPIIEVAVMVGVFHGKHRLSDPAHTLQRRPSHLREGGWPLLGQNGIELG